MGVFEIVMFAIAFVALCLSLYVCIKFKNMTVTLVMGLVAVALVLGVVISITQNSSPEKNHGQAPTPTFGSGTVGGGDIDVNVNANPMQTESMKPNVTDESAKPTQSATQKPVETDNETFTPTETFTAPPAVTPNGTPNGSTIYLTFDDGPSDDKTTETVLDALARHNVKATFFIVNFSESNVPVLKRIVRDGHTLGIHGYSHVYSDIYSSVDAGIENITKLRDKIREEVGYDATVIRFPGGSSNNASKQYCKGVMTALVKWANENGFTYVDWNVDPSDALSKLTPGEVSQRLKRDISSGRKANVVLLHDFEGQTGTAGALDDVITWALSNGYSFDRLTPDSPKCQHKVNN